MHSPSFTCSFVIHVVIIFVNLYNFHHVTIFFRSIRIVRTFSLPSLIFPLEASILSLLFRSLKGFTPILNFNTSFHLSSQKSHIFSTKVLIFSLQQTNLFISLLPWKLLVLFSDNFYTVSRDIHSLSFLQVPSSTFSFGISNFLQKCACVSVYLTV